MTLRTLLFRGKTKKRKRERESYETEKKETQDSMESCLGRVSAWTPQQEEEPRSPFLSYPSPVLHLLLPRSRPTKKKKKKKKKKNVLIIVGNAAETSTRATSSPRIILHRRGGWSRRRGRWTAFVIFPSTSNGSSRSEALGGNRVRWKQPQPSPWPTGGRFINYFRKKGGKVFPITVFCEGLPRATRQGVRLMATRAHRSSSAPSNPSTLPFVFFFFFFFVCSFFHSLSLSTDSSGSSDAANVYILSFSSSSHY